jgi:predicted DNA-binding transcriptional regulator AlpA
MYQRFTLQEGALFLRCSASAVSAIVANHKIRYIELPDGQVEFFGFQLFEYFLGCVTGGDAPTPKSSNPDKIIRVKEVLELTGLSRTTLWRLEKKGQFPARLPLSAGVLVGDCVKYKNGLMLNSKPESSHSIASHRWLVITVLLDRELVFPRFRSIICYHRDHAVQKIKSAIERYFKARECRSEIL